MSDESDCFEATNAAEARKPAETTRTTEAPNTAPTTSTAGATAATIPVATALQAAIGQGTDPSGTPWAEITPELLRPQRTSVKWTRYPADVLPMFVAEMDFAITPEVRRAIIARIDASDVGYLDGPGALAPAFADFAESSWGWEILVPHVHLATDVATGIVESLRVARPSGGRLVLPTPCYPGFFEMLEELNFEVAEVPLITAQAEDRDLAPHAHPGAALDLEAIEREFAEHGATAFVLCNPHNPHGTPFPREQLAELARLAAEHDVFVVSDEIHAPLTHTSAAFTPFAPLAAEAGALSVTTTSASKGWNIAGAKCSVIVAADDRANRVLTQLPPEVPTRTSILGLHGSIAAFTEGREWLQRTVKQVEANQQLLASLIEHRLPSVGYTPAQAGYLAWLDLRKTGLGDDPAGRILRDGRLALNDGRHFGSGGAGHARMNLACAPDTIVRGVDRIASLIGAGDRAGQPGQTQPHIHPGIVKEVRA